MNFLDLVFIIFLGFGFYSGTKRGFFAEVAAFIAFIIALYIAVKFSVIIAPTLDEMFKVDLSGSKALAFGVTFIAVVIGVHILAKFFTTVADFANLGLVNTIFGGVFGALKSVLFLGVVLHFFEKANINNVIIKKETIENSMFYNPLKSSVHLLFPVLEDWYTKAKEINVKNEAGE
jgi:membrane protein required for colicin V production